MHGDLLLLLAEAIEKSKAAVKERGDVTTLAVLRELGCSHQEVWLAVKDSLAEDHLEAIIKSKLRTVIAEADAPLLPGFEHIRPIIRIGRAVPIATAAAGLEQAEAYLEHLRKKTDGQSERAKAVLKEWTVLVRSMRRYSKTDPEINALKAANQNLALAEERKLAAADRRRQRAAAKAARAGKRS